MTILKFYSNRRDRRVERASTPPRFARGRGDRSRGFERGSRGRGRGRGGGLSAGSSKGAPLTKQNSSDMANEEWETASESSDVLLDRRDSKNDLKENRGDKRDVKKSFSNQRPQGDRQNRRSSDQRSKSERDHPKNLNKERIPSSSLTKNGYTGPQAKNGQMGGKRPPPNMNKREKENTNQVFRLDEVVPNDQTAINNAINNSMNEKQVDFIFFAG